ncbi:BON domain-containing protein [Pseudogulbenkiania subflava]|uniref:BON domain-containing protein n=1 Tax=Pseudogulbenkiania subflava DSM 22618 TaxID=1123014 RepID=A0A1Y6C274_9NEIS|nr:BON domain-containing protein [Pseudogulbenkiania subflava]SMF31752.1 BON domain-containing protein [Pseudogulbenkiania subflava DSM 22618]
MKQRVFASKLVMALLAATLLPAQFALADEAADAALATKVKAAIDANPTLKAFNLKVSGKNNDVTIEGNVDEGLQMAEVGAIAEKVDGVKFVFNNIMPKN